MPTVYKLINPVNETIYYVGYTTKAINIRLLGHMTHSKKLPTTELLLNSGLTPIIEIIEEGKNVTMETENYWIKKLKSEGYTLENTANGRKPLLLEPRNPQAKYIGDDKLKIALQQILDELPLSSSIPIVQRIKKIAEKALAF